jgi:sulfoquinovose isomerase
MYSLRPTTFRSQGSVTKPDSQVSRPVKTVRPIRQLNFDGTHSNTSRYWWPVTEAIGVLTCLMKLDRRPEDDAWYSRLWKFALGHFVDKPNGGWFPEIDANNQHSQTQFIGMPDIYHSLQAVLFPLADGVSRFSEKLGEAQPLGAD